MLLCFAHHHHHYMHTDLLTLSKPVAAMVIAIFNFSSHSLGCEGDMASKELM